MQPLLGLSTSYSFLAINFSYFEQLLELSFNSEISEQLLVLQIGLKPLMKLFQSHAIVMAKKFVIVTSYTK